LLERRSGLLTRRLWDGAIVTAVLSALLYGCSACAEQSGQEGIDSGTGDTSSDTDVDSDTDSDTDVDTDTDTDTDTDSDTDSDADTDADADTDTDADSDTETETGPALPDGCLVIEPTSDLFTTWFGRQALHDDHMVWVWIDYSPDPDEYVLMVRQLSTGTQSELLRDPYPEQIHYPTLFDGEVLFSRRTDSADEFSREIFSIGISDEVAVQLTDNEKADGYGIRGEQLAIIPYSLPLGMGISYLDLDSMLETDLGETIISLAVAFDRERWVAFYQTSSTVISLKKFDLETPDAGVQQVSPDDVSDLGLTFTEDCELISSIGIEDVTDGLDLVVWDMETDEYEIIVDDTLDQGLPDAYGHIIAYVDTQEAGTPWYGFYRGELRIADRETLVKRVVLPLDTYYSIGIWSHWIAANNVGLWGDSIILCDILEMGLVDDDGHVCPEEGCPEPDGGLDSGVDGGPDGG